MDRNSCSGICTDVICTLLLVSATEQSRITETQVYVGMKGLRYEKLPLITIIYYQNLEVGVQSRNWSKRLDFSARQCWRMGKLLW